MRQAIVTLVENKPGVLSKLCGLIARKGFNIINLSEMERARLLDAEWQAEEGESGRYMAEIKIYGNNRTGLLVDITKILTERQIDINAIHSNTSKQGVATITLSFETKGKEELSSMIDKIRQVESVIDIERTRG